MAIGSDRKGVIRMVLREGLALGLLGVTIGLVLSFLPAASLRPLCGLPAPATLTICCLWR
jgi:ABC-type antimicrobial peptide transport system permease subunit